EGEGGLAPAQQLEIDRGEELAVEQRAVLGARREVDLEAAAERVEAGRRAGEAAPGQAQRIFGRPVERRPPEALQLGVEEAQVELGVVDDEAGGAREGRAAVRHLPEGAG